MHPGDVQLELEPLSNMPWALSVETRRGEQRLRFSRFDSVLRLRKNLDRLFKDLVMALREGRPVEPCTEVSLEPGEIVARQTKQPQYVLLICDDQSFKAHPRALEIQDIADLAAFCRGLDRAVQIWETFIEKSAGEIESWNDAHKESCV